MNTKRTLPQGRDSSCFRWALFLVPVGLALFAFGAGGRAQEAGAGATVIQGQGPGPGDGETQDGSGRRPLGPHELEEVAAADDLPIAPEVSRALRRILSFRPDEQATGARELARLGLAGIADARGWVRRESRRLERVRLTLDRIVRELTGSGRVVPEEPLSREFSAEEFFRRRFENARHLLRSGDYERAREIAEAILVVDPDSPLAFSLRRLVRETRRRLMERKLEPRVDVEDLVWEVGDDPAVHFRLYNRSKATARVLIEDGIFGELFVQCEAQYQFGNAVRQESRIPLRVDRRGSGLTLRPGEFWELRLDDRRVLEAFRKLPLAGCAARLKLSASFRPTLWELEGEDDSNIPLSSQVTELWVVPPGKKGDYEDPVRRFGAAIILERDEDYLVAGWLCVWAGERDRECNGRFVRLLVSSLDETPLSRRRLAHQLLSAATGRSFRTSSEWREWWESRQDGSSGRSLPTAAESAAGSDAEAASSGSTERARGSFGARADG